MNVKKFLASILSGILIIGSVSYNPQNNKIVSSTISYAESTNYIEIWDGTADTSWYDDQETEFHIYNAQQLAGIASLTNTSKKSFSGKTIYIENDIYFNEINSKSNNWIPISNTNTFSGTIDGQNHYFFNYYSDKNGFIRINLGSIRNFNFINADSTSCGICSSNQGNIENCYYQGKVSNTNSELASGLCNRNYGNISNCVFNGLIEMTIRSSNAQVGGICGGNEIGIISNCHTYGKINIDLTAYNYKSFHYIGGICGRCTGNNISHCSNRMDINPKFCDKSPLARIGGICGTLNNDSQLSNCYNLGNIIIDDTPSSDSVFGGICGLNMSSNANIENAYNSGIIGSQSNVYCGGICGKNQDTSSKIKNTFYLNTSCASGVYNTADSSGIKSKNDNNMKNQDFVSSLGDEFIYVPDSFPRLACEKENEHTKFNISSLYFDNFNEAKKLELWEEHGSVNWVSTNPQVATVNSDGTVTPVSNGNAIIYALYGDEKAVCDVTVCAYSLDKSSVSIEEKAIQKINIMSNQTIVSPTQATFKSSDEKIAKVDSSGSITGVATVTLPP